MSNLDLKIAFRTFFKNKWYNILNIAGLALGLAAFIFVTLYVDNETSYDQWNKNVNHIFLVERELPNGPSPYTPGQLAAAIKNQCPEVEEAGRTNTALFQVPFYTSSGRFMVKKWVGADYSIAKILGIKAEGFKLNPHNAAPAILLSQRMAAVLFPHGLTGRNQTVNMLSKTGMPMKISGIAAPPPGNTSFGFDCIGFVKDLTQGKDQSYATQIYQTYLLVRPGTDIKRLSARIDKIYKEAALADTSQVARQAVSDSKPAGIYLDPLANLHLKPHYGSHANAQIVEGLVVLALIILVITGVNFTNLYLSQAGRRAREVGIKKVSGIVKRQLAFQFLLEIFFQCMVALLISFGIVSFGLPYFNQLLHVSLSLSAITFSIAAQLLLALLSITLLAGIYPSLVMAGFKPVDVLKGSQLTEGGKYAWIRRSITVLQFTFAASFVIVLLVINRQVRFMETDDPGFTAQQVVYIDNLGIYNSAAKFRPVHDRIKAIPGVKNVTVATNIPGGIPPAAHDFEVRGIPYSMNTIGVGYEYFETLNIRLKTGRLFNPSFPGDTANAVINETAAKAMHLRHPIGTTVNGCGGVYTICGVVKDVRAYGFEQQTQPTVYLMNDHCGLSKIRIMLRADGQAIPAILSALGKQWSSINKLDGDTFSYHFLDALYGQLFVKQEQLRAVLSCFSALAIFIASLGLFSMAAHAIRLRLKEIAIRKVFGATARHLLLTLSKPFFYMVCLANIIAWPLAAFVAHRWLDTFAYRVHLSVTPFVLAMAVSAAVVTVTVCLQIVHAVRFSPAEKLKE